MWVLAYVCCDVPVFVMVQMHNVHVHDG